MSIIPITSSLINAVTSVAPTTSAAPVASASDDGSSLGDSTQLSGLAQTMSQLQKLEQSNPVKAKKILTDIADKLQAQAAQVGGAEGQQLSALASKFQQAASTGDLSSLQPSVQAATQAAQALHGHHGHGHHRAHSAYGQTQAQGQSQSAIDIITSSLAAASL
jgi:hypothetical protein